jgi:hypothetical protein
MAVTANSIITPQTPIGATAVVTTANPTYTDAPTNTVQLLGAQTNGARIQKITALARATPTATELQLYVSSDGGTTKRFIKSVVMNAYTVAQTTAQPLVDFGYSDASPLILSNTESLWVGIGVTNTGIVFRAEGYAY